MMLKLYHVEGNTWSYLSSYSNSSDKILVNPKSIFWINKDTWKSLFGDNQYQESLFFDQLTGRNLSIPEVAKLKLLMESGLFSTELKSLKILGKYGIQYAKGMIELYDLNGLSSINAIKKLR